MAAFTFTILTWNMAERVTWSGNSRKYSSNAQKTDVLIIDIKVSWKVTTKATLQVMETSLALQRSTETTATISDQPCALSEID
jgi:hypothetical protein